MSDVIIDVGAPGPGGSPNIFPFLLWVPGTYPKNAVGPVAIGGHIYIAKRATSEPPGPGANDWDIWLAAPPSSADALLKASNLNDVQDKSVARDNIGAASPADIAAALAALQIDGGTY